MVQFRDPPHEHRHVYGDAAAMAPMSPSGSRFDEMASYATDTSSITNPVELKGSYDVDDATSALTGLTGWVCDEKGGEAGGASEFGDGEAFPAWRARHGGRSTAYAGGCGEREMAPDAGASQSMMAASDKISALTFDLNGLSVEVETVLGETGMPEASVNGSRIPLSEQPPPAGPGGTTSKAKGVSGGADTHSVTSSASGRSHTSNASKKRAPVPPLRDPNMDDSEGDQMWEEDCNYDINPTLLFLVLQSRDWKAALALLDGKGLENKNDAWNLGRLFGAGHRPKGVDAEAQLLAKKRQGELRAQARTWIVRRERTGVLRWRMLPLHAALAFSVPFDVVIRLYHLYPGAVRCRNDQGMLPLHLVFKHGNEDKVLELFLDVFPEALTVLDDKARLPLACTANDGSENERRSNILTLFSKFQVELANKELARATAVSDAGANAREAGTPVAKDTGLKVSTHALSSIQRPMQHTLSPIQEPLSPTSPTGEGTLGAVPRYTTNIDYTMAAVGSNKTPVAATSSPFNVLNNPQARKEKTPVATAPPSPIEDSPSDRYALLGGEDSENDPSIGNGNALNPGLATIPEEDSHDGVLALKTELLALSGKKKKKGLKKWFGKKRMPLM